MLKVSELSYHDRTVNLKDIEFNVDSGDFYVIFGPDDSGKTEILNAIMGITVPYKGKVLYKDMNIRRLSSKERKTIRFVPDSILMEKGIKGKTYIKRYMKQYKVGEVDYLDKLLQYFEIDAEQYLMDMTYEENKMISILSALLTFPELLILDEPANFLTDATMLKLLKLLGKLNRSGMTILMALEHYEEAEGFCNRIMYINDGTIINKLKVRQEVDTYRTVCIKEGNYKLLDKFFGDPTEINELGRTYLTGIPLEKISLILQKSGVKDKDVYINNARIEDMLDVAYKNKQESKE